MTSLRAALNRFPRVKALAKRVLAIVRPGYGGVSSHYVQMEGDEAGSEAARLRGSWQDHELPQKQRVLVDAQLTAFRRGESIDVFDVMVQALKLLPHERPMSVLEVGCSSGFYSEVLDIAKLDMTYAGCDYSEAFIALAREKYPDLKFDVEDATSLKYPAEAFDVVISGCCLLHIPEYQTAVAETARVASRYAIFHRTPVVLHEPDKYFRKLAYGVETVEIHFNEPRFLELLAANDMELVKTWTLSEQQVDGQTVAAVRTYLCRIVRANPA